MEETIPTAAPQSISSDTTHPSNGKFIAVLLFLMFFPLIGLILMWIFMKDWPKKVKGIVTIVYATILFIVILTQLYFMYLHLHQ